MLGYHVAAFDKLNRHASTTISNPMACTPTAALQAILRLEPMDLFLQKEALLKFANMIHKHKWDGFSARCRLIGHARILELKLVSLGAAVRDNVVCRNWTSLNIKISKGDSLAPIWTDIVVYTDGSKTSDGVGAGAVVKIGSSFFRFHCRLPNGSTVYQAEMEALFQAGLFLLKMNLTGKSIHVFSDSQASLMALNSDKLKSTQIVRTLETWDSLSKANKVTLEWVRAHVGTPGNEEADRLAKLGTTALDLQVDVLPSRAQTKMLIRSHFAQKWTTRWTTCKKYLHTKAWFPTPHCKQSIALNNMTKEKISRLIAFITDFNRLNAHSNKINPNVDPVCRGCGESAETANHLALDCGPLLTRSADLIGDVASGKWTMEGLLRFIDTGWLKDALLSTQR